MAKLLQISVRFEAEDMERLKAQAKKENRPTSNLITHVVCEYLNDHGKVPQI